LKLFISTYWILSFRGFGSRVGVWDDNAEYKKNWEEGKSIAGLIPKGADPVPLQIEISYV